MNDDPLVPDTEFLIHQTEDGLTRVQVRLQDGTIWMSQAAMAELYQSSKQNISLHVRHVLEEGKLVEDSVVKNNLTTAADGKRYRTLHYSLEMVLAAGYRVRSHRGTQFRRWETGTPREYSANGIITHYEWLKAGGAGPDDFAELVEGLRRGEES